MFVLGFSGLRGVRSFLYRISGLPRFIGFLLGLVRVYRVSAWGFMGFWA